MIDVTVPDDPLMLTLADRIEMRINAIAARTGPSGIGPAEPLRNIVSPSTIRQIALEAAVEAMKWRRE